jgi:hypothetical protein
VLDGLRAKGREQRLIHRAGTPGAQDRDEQFGPARQQAGHGVAGLHATRLQEIGEARGERFQLVEAVALGSAVLAFPLQRQAVGTGVAVAALHAGVHAAGEAAGQITIGVLRIEARIGLGIGWCPGRTGSGGIHRVSLRSV